MNCKRPQKHLLKLEKEQQNRKKKTNNTDEFNEKTVNGSQKKK